MFKTPFFSGVPTFADFAVTPTTAIHTEFNNMKIGLVPFHPFTYKLQPHLKKAHMDEALLKVASALVELGHEPELIELKDLQVVKHPSTGSDYLSFLGGTPFLFIFKLDLITTPDFLHNYLWMHSYSGAKYDTVVGQKSSFSFGKDSHLDCLDVMTMDLIAESAANALNINFYLNGKIAEVSSGDLQTKT